MKKQIPVLNENKLRKIVKSQLLEMVDKDYFNGFIYGHLLREKIFTESKLIIRGKYGKQITENSTFLKEVNELANKNISIAVQKINEGEINEFLPAVIGTAALDTAAGGIGQGEGSYGQNLKKYVNNRKTNRQNYIQNGVITGYDENGQPIYDNSGSKFWRGLKSGLATAAPWVGSAAGSLVTLPGNVVAPGVASIVGGTAGYSIGNAIGKNYNGNTQVMTKELRKEMQNDANNFKSAYMNGEQYTSPFISKGVNNPYIDMAQYNELNGVGQEGNEEPVEPSVESSQDYTPGQPSYFANDPEEVRRFQMFAKNELRTYGANIDGKWGPKTQLSWDIYNENTDARPADFANDSNEVRRFQLYAVDQGLYNGTPDGIWGPKTQRAWNQVNANTAASQISQNSTKLSYPQQ